MVPIYHQNTYIPVRTTVVFVLCALCGSLSMVHVDRLYCRADSQPGVIKVKIFLGHTDLCILFCMNWWLVLRFEVIHSVGII
jgi:hypothetical protein